MYWLLPQPCEPLLAGWIAGANGHVTTYDRGNERKMAHAQIPPRNPPLCCEPLLAGWLGGTAGRWHGGTTNVERRTGIVERRTVRTNNEQQMTDDVRQTTDDGQRPPPRRQRAHNNGLGGHCPPSPLVCFFILSFKFTKSYIVYYYSTNEGKTSSNTVPAPPLRATARRVVRGY
jgi:hypothetical protein